MTERGWALVTGAARRLGQTLALCAAGAGHDIVIHARRPQDGEETARAVRALGRKAVVAAGDLADAGALPALIAAAPAPPSLLVNCASVFEADRIGDLTPEALDTAWRVNLRAPVLLSQAFAAALPADAEGLIVNIVDQRVWRLNPRFLGYTLSKAALWTATQTLAQALAPRIRVNAIGPGPVLASIHQNPETFAAEAAGTPLGRPVDPAEIAGALRYLLDARSVTGQMIAVDAGQHLAWRTPDIVDG